MLRGVLQKCLFINPVVQISKRTITCQTQLFKRLLWSSTKGSGGGGSWFRNFFGSSRSSTESRISHGAALSLVGGGIGLTSISLSFMGFFTKEEEKEETLDEKIIMTLKRAILAIQRDEFSKAERFLSNAWKLTEKSDKTEEGVAMEDIKTQIIDMQANLAFQTGNLAKAERLFKVVAQRLVQMKGVSPEDNSIIEISIKLAQIYTMNDRILDAISGLEYSIESVEKRINNGDNDQNTLMLAGWSSHNLGQIYMNLATLKPKSDLIKQASELMKNALAYVKADGPDSYQAISIQGDIAAIHALNGEYEIALEKIMEAEKSAEVNHEFLLACLRVNRGNIYLQKGEFSEADRICLEAKNLAGKLNDSESLHRAEECIAKSKSLLKEASLVKSGNVAQSAYN